MTIVAVALPAIRDSFGLSPEGLQWILTAYTLTFGGLLVATGRPATCSAGAGCSRRPGDVRRGVARVRAGAVAAGSGRGARGAGHRSGGACAGGARAGRHTARPPPRRGVVDGGGSRRRRVGLGARRRAGAGARVAGGVRRERAAVRDRRAARAAPAAREPRGRPRSSTSPGPSRSPRRSALLVLGLTQLPAALPAAAAAFALFVVDRAPRRRPDPARPDAAPARVRAREHRRAGAHGGHHTPAMFLAILYQQEVLGRSALEAGLWCAPFNLAVIAGSLLGRRVPMAAGLAAIAAGALTLLLTLSPAALPSRSCSWAPASAAPRSPRRRPAPRRSTRRAGHRLGRAQRVGAGRQRRRPGRARRPRLPRRVRGAAAIALVGGHTIDAKVPPSTDHAAPVTFDARSEHRKTTTAAISSGSAKRPIGTRDAWSSIAGLRASRGPSPRRSDRRARRRPPTAASGRAGRDRVHEHALLRVGVGEHAAQRALRRLRHRVGGVGERRALAGRRGDVDDPAPAALGHAGGERAHQPHRRHDVQLPEPVPVVVGRARRGARAKLVPALLTRMSTGPGARSAIRSAASGAVTSIPSPRDTRSTFAPSASSAVGRRAPMPRVAPVTTATRPEIPRSIYPA